MVHELTHIAANLSVRISFHPLDDVARHHLSARYWQWLELFEHDPAARISQHPDHIFAETSFGSSGHDPIVLCEATRGDQLIALGVLVPKLMTWRQAGGFGLYKNLSGYRLAGNRFLGENHFDVLQRMLGACEDFCQQHGAMYLLIEDLEQTGVLADAARSIAHLGTKLFCLTDWQEWWTIEFPTKPEDYWAKFTGKSRYNFRRMCKQIGNARFVKVTEPEQVAEFLEAAHVVSLRSWQSKKLGLRIRNDASEMTMFTFLASQQALRAYLLFVNEQPAAFLVGTQFRGRFSDEEVGYDHALSERSPGKVLLIHVLEDLIRHDTPAVFDFGGGDAPYKALFATTQSASATVWLVSSSWRACMWLRLLQVCRIAERAARRVVKRLGLTTLVRQLIRGRRADWTNESSTNDSEVRTDGAA